MTVQRFPAGLLELLSAKTSGWTPGAIARDVQPTLDMLEMFGNVAIEHKSINNAVAAENDYAELVVPANTWWLLYAADANYLKTGTMSLGLFSLRIAQPGGTDWVTIAYGPNSGTIWGSTGALQVAACVFVPPRPWLLPPGTRIFARVDVLGTDPTCDIGLNLRVAVLS